MFISISLPSAHIVIFSQVSVCPRRGVPHGPFLRYPPDRTRTGLGVLIPWTGPCFDLLRHWQEDFLIAAEHQVRWRKNLNRIYHFFLLLIPIGNASIFIKNWYRNIKWPNNKRPFFRRHQIMQKVEYSSFPIFRNFLPNHDIILPALTCNGSQSLNANTGRILPGFGWKLRNIGKLEYHHCQIWVFCENPDLPSFNKTQEV